jgi:GNAT superfamily N-acetyltransferase
MRLCIKNRGANKLEAWVEIIDDVVCESKLLLMGTTCLINTIDTKPEHQGKGYATFLVKELQKKFPKVAPIRVTRSAEGFWDRLGMKDALGKEE